MEKFAIVTLKIQKSQVKKAIEGSGGYMTTIAKRLNCDWHTAERYVRKYELFDEIKIEDERLNDLTERMLLKNIENGDTTAIIFRLKTKAKNRGYVERTEMEHILNTENTVRLIPDEL